MADAEEVRIGYAGLAYEGQVGTVAPVGLTTSWGTGWHDLGLMSEDGLTEGSDQDRTEVRAWGYDSPVRTQISRKVTTFSVVFLETNAYVLSLYHAVPLSDMSSTGAGDTQFLGFIQGQNTAPDERALGLDIIDGARRFRFIVPRCEVTDRGEIVYKGDEPVGYEVTFTALLSSDGTTMQRMYGGVALPA
jgi:hypothetical protein